MHKSRIIDEGDDCVLESTATPLPVLVTEVLTAADRSAELSVRVSESGWAWLVCGRRLLVWRYAASEPQPGGERRRVALCRELTLPPSDLAHRAQLVQLLGGSHTHVPSCLAASPEGALRYWPSIIHESSSVERNAHLQGQECDRLVALGAAGCLLVTTTCSLVLVSWRQGLLCRRLASPDGLLAGIGRRMSSLIWGSMHSAGVEQRLVSVRSAGQTAYVLTESRLQRWWVEGSGGAAAGAGDRVDWDVDLERMARDSLLQAAWSGGEGLQVRLCDLWVSPVHGLLVLVSACSAAQSGAPFYALGTLDDSVAPAPVQFRRFDVLRRIAAPEEAADAPDPTLLGAGDSLFILRQTDVVCVNVLCASDSADTLALGASAAGAAPDRLLGCGFSADAAPLIFTRQHGLLRLATRSAAAEPSLHSTSLSVAGLLDQTSAAGVGSGRPVNISLSQAELDEVCASDDSTALLRAAWILFCQNDLARCSELVETAFPPPITTGPDSPLDRTVLELSTDIVDDFPACDPRWADSAAHDGTLSGAGPLILLHQLEEKRHRHRLFIDFLRATGLWQQLTSVSSDDATLATWDLLQQHQEKIVAAETLASQPKHLAAVVEAAVAAVVAGRGESPVRPLTAQDLFFRRLSRLDELLPALLQLLGQQQQDAAGRQATQLVTEVNTVLLSLLRAVETARRAAPAAPAPAGGSTVERRCWSRAGAARPLLLQQYRTTLQHAAPTTEPAAVRTLLYQQLMELADVTLAGYQEQLDSVGGQERAPALHASFEQDRYTLIGPLVEAGQYERACSLAEKYMDFRALVEICERTNSPERRNKYLTQFVDQGFAGFVFNWYLERGDRSQLLTQCRRVELAEFLSEYRGLRWLNELEAGRYGSAADTLAHCANAETEFLTRKKTYLSLSKLCALAGCAGSELDTRLEGIQPAVDLVSLQEQLPATVLEAHGIDPETMHVLSARELILLYVSPENVDANEFDFARALELADACASADGQTDDEEPLHLQVWSRAVLRDDWLARDTDDPAASCADTLLLRTAELLRLGAGSGPALPAPQQLLGARQLQPLAADSRFEFLMRALYEHINRLDQGDLMVH